MDSIGKNKFTMKAHDNYLQLSWVCSLRDKTDAADVFELALADVRAESIS